MSRNRAPETVHRNAADRAAAVAAVQADCAIDVVACDFGVTPATVRRWVWKARAAARAGRTAVEGLIDRKPTGRPPVVWSKPGAEAAWRIWLANYLRSEQPTAAGSRETSRRVGLTRGWYVPDVKTFLRRLRDEVPAAQVVRAREGRLAALATYPFQQRTVEGLAPLDFVNGDGYRHNLFVLPPGGDGEPFRPVTWFWQDVRTRRVLAWRSGPTESADLVRLAFHGLVTTHGAPGGVVIDNTRAASAKWFSNKSPRWRRDRDDTVEGILDLLDIRPIYTGVEHEENGKARGHGWAKPVERAFGADDLGQAIDKHPRAAGAFTGRSPLHKPANYDDSNALDWDVFLAVVDDGVAAHNARPGRRTEAAASRSFDETWETEIATTPVRRLTRAQEALLLMAVESRRVQKGSFRLQAARAAGLPQNNYWHEDLVALSGQRVVVRYDPDHLHAGAEVFDAKGRWLCRAECVLPVGFADTDGARTRNRARRKYQRHLDQANAAREAIGEVLDEYGVALPAAAPQKRGPQPVLRMTPDEPGRPDTERRRALEAKRDLGLKRMAESG